MSLATLFYILVLVLAAHRATLIYLWITKARKHGFRRSLKRIALKHI